MTTEGSGANLPAAANRALILAGFVAVIASGCGGSQQTGLYAGLSAYDAGSAAQSAMAEERSDPESDLYNKELIVEDVSKGRTAGGREAWVATFTDFENHRSAMCLWIWSGGNTPFRSNYVYDVGRCRDAGTS